MKNSHFIALIFTFSLFTFSMFSQDKKSEIALKFINSYIDNIIERNGQNMTEWVLNNDYSTREFKSELKTIISNAEEKNPGFGLGFDPILNAQDFPEDGFELSVLSNETNYLTVKAKNWKTFEIKMRVKKESNRWLVNGCGIVNIPKTEIIEN